jgi:hypothetical protein
MLNGSESSKRNSMIIEKIQVEGGFLDGLELGFTSGLNIVIGARGAGKTSILELIRFCLGARALTDKAAQTAREHAMSILGDGTVSVSVTDGAEGAEPVTLNRSAEQWTSSNTAVKVSAAARRLRHPRWFPHSLDRRLDPLRHQRRRRSTVGSFRRIVLLVDGRARQSAH